MSAMAGTAVDEEDVIPESLKEFFNEADKMFFDTVHELDLPSAARSASDEVGHTTENNNSEKGNNETYSELNEKVANGVKVEETKIETTKSVLEKRSSDQNFISSSSVKNDSLSCENVDDDDDDDDDERFFPNRVSVSETRPSSRGRKTTSSSKTSIETKTRGTYQTWKNLVSKNDPLSMPSSNRRSLSASKRLTKETLNEGVGESSSNMPPLRSSSASKQIERGRPSSSLPVRDRSRSSSRTRRISGNKLGITAAKLKEEKRNSITSNKSNRSSTVMVLEKNKKRESNGESNNQAEEAKQKKEYSANGSSPLETTSQSNSMRQETKKQGKKGRMNKDLNKNEIEPSKRVNVSATQINTTLVSPSKEVEKRVTSKSNVISDRSISSPLRTEKSSNEVKGPSVVSSTEKKTKRNIVDKETFKSNLQGNQKNKLFNNRISEEDDGMQDTVTTVENTLGDSITSEHTVRELKMMGEESIKIDRFKENQDRSNSALNECNDEPQDRSRSPKKKLSPQIQISVRQDMEKHKARVMSAKKKKRDSMELRKRRFFSRNKSKMTGSSDTSLFSIPVVQQPHNEDVSSYTGDNSTLGSTDVSTGKAKLIPRPLTEPVPFNFHKSSRVPPRTPSTSTQTFAESLQKYERSGFRDFPSSGGTWDATPTIPTSPNLLTSKIKSRVKESNEDSEGHFTTFKARPVPKSMTKINSSQKTRSVTTPKPFRFNTSSRDRKTGDESLSSSPTKGSSLVLTTEEIYLAECANQFRARPMPDLSFKPLSATKAHRELTTPKPFRLHSSRRSLTGEKALTTEEIQAQECEYQFKAKPIPSSFYKPSTPKTSSPKKKLTSIQSFNFLSDQRHAAYENEDSGKPLTTEEREALECAKQFRARPVPANFYEVLPQKVVTPKALTTPKPFSFYSEQKKHFMNREDTKLPTSEELKAAECANQFKARPLPDLSYRPPVVTPTTKAREVTVPDPFHLHQPRSTKDLSKETSKDDLELIKKFHALPMPDLSYRPPRKSLSSRALVLTTPKPFKLSENSKVPKVLADEDDEVNKKFKATPMPNLTYRPPKLSEQALSLKSRVTVCKPFRLLSRHVMAMKNRLESNQVVTVDDIELAKKFHARPVPASTFEPPSGKEKLLAKMKEKTTAKLTVPQPFRLETDIRHEAYEAERKQMIEYQLEEEKSAREVKAKPPPIFDEDKVFVPRPSTKNLTEPQPFKLSTSKNRDSVRKSGSLSKPIETFKHIKSGIYRPSLKGIAPNIKSKLQAEQRAKFKQNMKLRQKTKEEAIQCLMLQEKTMEEVNKFMMD